MRKLLVIVLFVTGCSLNSTKAPSSFELQYDSNKSALLETQKELVKELSNFMVITAAVNVRYFETKPGSKGKPNSVVYVLEPGNYPVFQIFDWIDLDPRLVGNHKWIRVDENLSHWVYFNPKTMELKN